MKVHVLAIALTVCQTLSASPPPEKKGELGRHRDVYLTVTKGIILTTTDARVKILTKKSISETDNHGWVQAELLIATELKAASNITFTIYQRDNPQSDVEILGNFNLRGSVGYRKKQFPGFDSFPFQIRKDLFTNSIVMFSNSTESFQLYLRPEREGEQASTGQPATRPEVKSEGSDKPQPEAEGRSR